MNKLKSMLYRFMYGRYGSDQFNVFLMVLTIVLLVLNMIFFKNGFLSLLIWVILIYQIFRTYSKNIYKRRMENNKFLTLIHPFKKRANLAKKQAQDKEHRYFICPSCKQNVRVPRGKGKIVITCPKCGNKFEKRT